MMVSMTTSLMISSLIVCITHRGRCHSNMRIAGTCVVHVQRGVEGHGVVVAPADG